MIETPERIEREKTDFTELPEGAIPEKEPLFPNFSSPILKSPFDNEENASPFGDNKPTSLFGDSKLGSHFDNDEPVFSFKSDKSESSYIDSEVIEPDVSWDWDEPPAQSPDDAIMDEIIRKIEERRATITQTDSLPNQE